MRLPGRASSTSCGIRPVHRRRNRRGMGLGPRIAGRCLTSSTRCSPSRRRARGPARIRAADRGLLLKAATGRARGDQARIMLATGNAVWGGGFFFGRGLYRARGGPLQKLRRRGSIRCRTGRGRAAAKLPALLGRPRAAGPPQSGSFIALFAVARCLGILPEPIDHRVRSFMYRCARSASNPECGPLRAGMERSGEANYVLVDWRCAACAPALRARWGRAREAVPDPLLNDITEIGLLTGSTGSRSRPTAGAETRPTGNRRRSAPVRRAAAGVAPRRSGTIDPTDLRGLRARPEPQPTSSRDSRFQIVKRRRAWVLSLVRRRVAGSSRRGSTGREDPTERRPHPRRWSGERVDDRRASRVGVSARTAAWVGIALRG
jgi:hypothetical protein